MIKEIIIDRSKWRTGQSSNTSTGVGITSLINWEGYKCCLGFIACAYKKKAKYYSYPSETKSLIPFLTQRNDYGEIVDTQLTNKAIDINDNIDTTPQQKEKLLKQLFKGKFKLKFVGKYTKGNSNE